MQTSGTAVAACAMVWMAAACAGYRVPDRIISTDWATVQALPPGTMVAVMLSDGKIEAGAVQLVTDHDLTIKEVRGLSNVSRANVARVSLRQYTTLDHSAGVARGAAMGAAAGIPLALLLASRDEEHQMGGAEAASIVVGMGVGAIAGSYATPEKRFDDRAVYIHQ